MEAAKSRICRLETQESRWCRWNLKTFRGKIPLCLGKAGLSVLARSLNDWMRPTHVMDRSALFRMHGFKCYSPPEGYGPLIVLPGLDCCSFTLTLITGRGGTKRNPTGPPASQTYSSLAPLGRSSPISPWRSGSITPASPVPPSLPVDSEAWGDQVARWQS